MDEHTYKCTQIDLTTYTMGGLECACGIWFVYSPMQWMQSNSIHRIILVAIMHHKIGLQWESSMSMTSMCIPHEI